MYCLGNPGDEFRYELVTWYFNAHEHLKVLILLSVLLWFIYSCVLQQPNLKRSGFGSLQ